MIKITAIDKVPLATCMPNETNNKQQQQHRQEEKQESSSSVLIDLVFKKAMDQCNPDLESRTANEKNA